MHPIYVLHISGFSAQNLESDKMNKPEKGYFTTLQPDYSKVIPPLQARRMSKTLKLGVYSGMTCLQEWGIQTPDGIITCTAKGSMNDTERFVNDMINYKEETLNPTPFIMSTYNTINGALALQTQATGYSQTFVNGGSALESAFFDAQLNLNIANDEALYYLVGCFEETTPEHFELLKKSDRIKTNYDPSRSLLLQSDSVGTISGEGVHFFLTSNHPESAVFAINHIKSWIAESIDKQLDKYFSENSIKKNSIDLLLLGMNGDKRDEADYQNCIRHFSSDIPILCYKNLCGEYQTAAGFGLELLSRYLEDKSIPEEAWYRKSMNSKKPLNILYYNHFENINHNLMLIHNCKL